MTTQRYEEGMRHSITCINCGFQSYCVPYGHGMSDDAVDEAIEWSWQAHWRDRADCKAFYDCLTQDDWAAIDDYFENLYAEKRSQVSAQQGGLI